MIDTAVQVNGTVSPGILEKVVIGGDLSGLSPADRVKYYSEVCRSLGLNPLTKPFAYLSLNSKLVLYALRDCTDQLRKVNKVSIGGLVRERHEDVYVVTAHATTPDGRTDESIGAVSIAGLKGEALANAMMKAETKSKRRVTLSIVGLGMLDETEIETIPTAQEVAVSNTGEIVEPAQIAQPRPPVAPAKQTEVRPSSFNRPVENGYYDGLVDKAILLGVPYKARLETWADSFLAQESSGLKNRIRVAEEAGAAKG